MNWLKNPPPECHVWPSLWRSASGHQGGGDDQEPDEQRCPIRKKNELSSPLVSRFTW